MLRIACLRIPQFPIVVQQKLEPDLLDRAFVVVAGKGRTAEVVFLSPQAEQRQVKKKMRLSYAYALCPELIVLPFDHKLYESEQMDFLKVLSKLTPRLTPIALGTFSLDASGQNLLGGEKSFAQNVLNCCWENGFAQAKLGIADSVFASWVATYAKQPIYIVSAHNDKKFLAPLSIDFLPVSAYTKDSLRALGISKLGKLVEFSKTELYERFGEDGDLAYELSCGYDPRWPALFQEPLEFKQRMDLNHPVSTIDETLFASKSILNKLLPELASSGYCVEELTLVLENESTCVDRRIIKLIKPSLSLKFLLDVLRLSLEKNLPGHEFTAITIIFSRFCKQAYSQVSVDINENFELSDNHSGLLPDVIRLKDEASSEIAPLILQRFVSRFGYAAIVSPLPTDQFVREDAACFVPVLDGCDRVMQIEHKGIGTRECAKEVLPLCEEVAGFYEPGYKSLDVAASCNMGLVLKKYKVPSAVLVRVVDNLPAALVYQQKWYRLRQVTRGERISALWTGAPIDKTAYTALIEPLERKERGFKCSAGIDVFGVAAFVELVFDHLKKSWFIEGEYD